MLLAHTPDPAVVKAYRTTDFFKHRKPAMQEWADFLTQTMGPTIQVDQNSGWSMPGISPDTISCAIDKKAGSA